MISHTSTAVKAVQRPRGQAEISRTPLSALEAFITPTELHYVRDHLTDPPDLDAATWRLRVDGLVQKALSLSLADLLRLPMTDLTVTMECAGNSGPKSVVGVGCISTAVWRGPRLGDVIVAAGVDPSAQEVVLTGADRGRDPDETVAAGPYARSLPLEKALDPDIIIALFMNGEPLPQQHGFPARVVVPGWYGVDSIKWLASIHVQREPFQGYYMIHRYRETRGPDGLDVGRSVRPIVVKSAIARPTLHEQLALGQRYRIRGAAWAGAAEVAEVRVSTDNGATWDLATLVGPPVRYAWRQWEYGWIPKRLGNHTVVARAIDRQGRMQPLDRNPSQVYEANWVQRVPVRVIERP